MENFKAVISALNDNKNLKSRTFISILFEFIDECSGGSVGINELVKFLDGFTTDGDTRKKRVCKKAISHLNEVNLAEYLEYLEEIEGKGIRFLPFYNVVYPQQLWRIEDPPLGLYINGSTSVLFGGIAIVGTRKATTEREDYVEQLAGELTKEGYPIVSGLANGIDTAAHEGAIKVNGRTAAVLPGGVQTIRPSSNKELGQKIPNHGALVAELSDKETIHRGRFVERNRITSGLSIAVIIGASGETGGTIRQAEFAQEQARPRFIYDPQNDDGQSPKKLDEYGVVRFSSNKELKSLLNEDWREPASGPSFQHGLKEFDS